MKFAVMQDVLRLSGTKLFDAAARAGFEGVELCVHDVRNNEWFSTQGMQLLQRAAAGEYGGLRIPSVALLEFNRYGYANEDPAVRRATTDTMLRSMHYCYEAGIPLMLVPFFNAGEIKHQEALRRVAEGLEEVSGRAEAAGVTIAIETTRSAADHLWIIGQCRSDSVKIYYDVCNAVYWNHSIREELPLIRNHLAQIHFKDGHNNPWDAMLGEGFVDFDAAAEAILEVEYDGWIVLESHSVHDLIQDAANNLKFSKSVLASAARQE